MEKLKVLHIITNLALGGAQKTALQMIEGLDPHRFEKHFICAAEGGLFSQAKKYFAEQGIACYVPAHLKRQIAPLSDLRAFFEILNYIKKNKIDIVHTHSSKAGIIGRLAAKAAGARGILHSVHGWSFNDHLLPMLSFVYVYLEKITAKFTTAFVMVSESDIKKGLKNNIGNPEQYHLIRYGIDEKEFALTGRSVLGEKQSGPTITMIACLKPQKQPLDFLRMARIVLREYPGIRFISVGDGILRKKMQAFIRTWGLKNNVQLLGWRRDIHDILQETDIVVLNSLWEGLPIALIEAMAMAKPIVAYDTDGVREIIIHGYNGFLVKQKDVTGLSGYVKQLLADPKKAVTLGQNGKQRFKELDLSVGKMNKLLNELYLRLSDGKTSEH